MNQSNTTSKLIAELKAEKPLSFSDDELHMITRKLDMAFAIGYDYGRMMRSPKRTVLQLDEYGKIIREYDSARTVARALNINYSSVCKVCRGERHKAGGFSWMFKSDYDTLKNQS